MRLGVCTSRAHGRCFRAFGQVATVSATPYHHLISLEHPVGFDVAGQLDIPLFMLFLGNGNHLPDHGGGGKALVLGYLGKSRIQFGVLETLTGCGSL